MLHKRCYSSQRAPDSISEEFRVKKMHAKKMGKMGGRRRGAKKSGYNKKGGAGKKMGPGPYRYAK